MTPKEFLKQFTNGDENCSITYRPYEYGSLVETIHFSEAQEKIIKDIEEMTEFFQGFHLKDVENKAIQSVYKNWQEKIIVFK